MTFEMKYDRNRNPIIDPTIKTQSLEDTPEKTIQEESAIEQPVADDLSTTEIVAPEQKPEPEQKKESPAQDSFRELRMKAEKAERERDELLRIIREQESQRSQVKSAEPEEDNEVNLGNDDLVEGKHLSKVGRQIKKLQQEINQYKQQSSEVATEVKLKTLYPDFDKIVSRENIESLRVSYPEIANTINSSSGDLYSKAVSAYTMIKKLGIIQEPVVDIYKEDKERAQANAAKPRPLSSVSPIKADSPLSHANAFAKGLTKELQEQLRREMEDARRAM
jgi:hypothetical protein